MDFVTFKSKVDNYRENKAKAEATYTKLELV